MASMFWCTHRWQAPAVALALATAAAPAGAVAYRLAEGSFGSANGTGCGLANFRRESLVGAVGQALCKTAGSTGLVSARADAGGLGALAVLGGQVAPGFSVGDGRAEATALTRGDLLFTGPGDTTRVRLALDLSGGVGLLMPQLGTRATETVSLRVELVAFSGLGSWVDRWTLNLDPAHGASVNTFSGQLFSGYAGGNLSLLLPEISVPLNRPVTLEMQLGARVTTEGTGALTASAASSYMDTLKLPGDRPVFQFAQPGFTVNSADFGIVDNRVMAAVPEPSAAVLLVSGLLATAGWAAWAARSGRASDTLGAA